jgi:hypothetical protein
MTKSQLENLFYNEQINILQNGKTETYTIPINKRIYVFEDIDCQCDIILDRASDTVEQLLIKKNEELRKQIEELKTMINDKVNQTKVIGNNQHKHSEEDRKADNSSQKITLSFILNLFDGILETPGRITIMTTNFVDKLDKAFTRPGRIDIIGKFGFSDAEQIIQIIEHRYDTKLTPEQLNLIYNIPQCITPAEIGRILFENFTDLDGALHSLMGYSESYLITEQEKIAKLNKNKAIVNAIDENNEQKVKELVEEVSELVPFVKQPDVTYLSREEYVKKFTIEDQNTKELVEEVSELVTYLSREEYVKKFTIEDQKTKELVEDKWDENSKKGEEHHKNNLPPTKVKTLTIVDHCEEQDKLFRKNRENQFYTNADSINTKYVPLDKYTKYAPLDKSDAISMNKQSDKINSEFMPNNSNLFSGNLLKYDTYSTEYGTEIKN